MKGCFGSPSVKLLNVGVIKCDQLHLDKFYPGQKCKSDAEIMHVLENLEVLKQKETFKKSSKKVLLSEVEFMESEFADFEVFQQFIHEGHPDIDANYYYLKIKSWLDKNTAEKPKRKVWKNVINQFIQNDYKNGQVVTITKSKGHGKSTPNNFRQTNIFEQQTTPEQLDDLVSQYFANR